MAEDKARILSKIRKCLALAGSKNPHEAETALRQARKLMEIHNIDSVEVELSGIREHVFPAGYAVRSPVRWRRWLAQAAAESLGCDTFYRVHNGRQEVIFVGVGEAPELASYAFMVLERQIRKDRQRYIESICDRTLSQKRQLGTIFMEAWVNNIRRHIEAFAGADEQTASAIELYLRTRYPDLIIERTKRRHFTSVELDAYLAGESSAANARLRRPVSGSERSLLGFDQTRTSGL